MKRQIVWATGVLCLLAVCLAGSWRSLSAQAPFPDPNANLPPEVFGMVSPFMVTVDTSGVDKARNAWTLTGTFAMGVATGMPNPLTSWQVEHRPKPRTASENRMRPRSPSAESTGAAAAAGAGTFVATIGFAMPFSLET